MYLLSMSYKTTSKHAEAFRLHTPANVTILSHKTLTLFGFRISASEYFFRSSLSYS